MDNTKETPMRVSVLRGLLTGNLFLFVAIFQSITLVFDVIDAFRSKNFFTSVVEIFREASERFNIPIENIASGLDKAAPVIDTVLFSVSIFNLIFPALLTVGCLMLYGGAKNENDALASKGALLCRIYCILNIVSLSFAIFGAVSALSVITGFSLMWLITGAAVLLIGVLSLIFIFWAKLSLICGGIQKTFLGKKCDAHHSRYVIIAGKVWMVLSIFSALRGLPFNILSVVPDICGAVCVANISEILSRYMKRTGEE